MSQEFTNGGERILQITVAISSLWRMSRLIRVTAKMLKQAGLGEERGYGLISESSRECQELAER